jgi:hypothetical protein
MVADSGDPVVAASRRRGAGGDRPRFANFPEFSGNLEISSAGRPRKEFDEELSGQTLAQLPSVGSSDIRCT